MNYLHYSPRLNPPAWVSQNIMSDDADLLISLLFRTNPAEVIEIGVGSGWSSFVILSVLQTLGGYRRLLSYDISENCQWAPEHKIGSVVKEIAPELLQFWTLNLGNSQDAGVKNSGKDVALAFIDANHSHPYPCEDLLMLLPALGPASWVVLHDVNLPNVVPGNTDDGAVRLFQAWPNAQRIQGSGQGNMGAIQLPGKPGVCAGFVESIITAPSPLPVPVLPPHQLKYIMHGASK